MAIDLLANVIILAAWRAIVHLLPLMMFIVVKLLLNMIAAMFLLVALYLLAAMLTENVK
jgi:hypothetical protein